MPTHHAIVTLPDDTKVPVVLDSEAPPHLNIAAILGSAPVVAAIAAEAEAAGPMLHWRHGNDVVESDQAAEVVDAFLKTGEISDAEEVIRGWVDEYDYYAGMRSEAFSTNDEDDDWGRFVAEAEAALDAAGCDGSDFRSTFEDAAMEALAEADDTAPLDQMDRALKIGVVFVAGKESGLGVDDLAVQPAVGAEVSGANVCADAAMENFLRFVNISSDDYRLAVLQASGRDLHDIGADLPPGSYLKARADEASGEWKAMAVMADPSRPALITPDQAVEILDNASYGGAPVCYAYLDPKTFLKLPWDAEGQSGAQAQSRASVDLTGSGKGKPMIGIHDFMNGSGHFVQVDGLVRLPLDHRNWHADGARYGYGINKTYDLYRPAFMVDPVAVAPAVAAEPEQEPQAGLGRVVR